MPFSPDVLDENTNIKEKINNANKKKKEKSSVNSPTVKKLTILSPQFSSFVASVMISELPEIEETGKR